MPDDRATLVDRLRGIYRIPITDGLGPAGGDEPDNPDEHVRRFETPPIHHEAADEIARLRFMHEADRRVVNRWVPCPDHRDKTTPGTCYVCENARLRRLLGRLVADPANADALAAGRRGGGRSGMAGRSLDGGKSDA